MNRDEFERLKEAEKAHLRKVRQLKEQLRDARRTQRVSEALEGLDTSALDDEFEESLRAVQTQSLTSEARFELAMDALDAAEKRERARLETEQFEAERRKAEAADIVRKMKAELDVQDDAAAESGPTGSQARHGASALTDDPAGGSASGDAGVDERPPKTIGRRPSSSD